jgi:hypothetical protein
MKRCLVLAFVCLVSMASSCPNDPSCNFDLAVTASTLDAAGGQGNATVTPAPSTPGCTWTASTSPAFLTLSGQTTGSGQGTFSYAAGANSSQTPRTADVVLNWSDSKGSGSRRATITQSGTPAVTPTIVVNPTTQSVGGTAQSGLTVDVTANVAWTAVSSQVFVTITGGAPGSGNGTITYSVAANTGVARTATITVSGGGAIPATLTINQGTLTLSVNPTTQNVSAAGQVGFMAVVTSNTMWTATSNQAFVAITNGSSGTGNGVITFSVDPNNDAPRTATITVTGGGANATLTVNQSGLTLAVTPTQRSVSSGQQAGLTVAVTANVAWTAQSNQSFVTITNGSSGTEDGTITYTVDANTGGARSATITVSGGGTTATHTIDQSAFVAAAAFRNLRR